MSIMADLKTKRWQVEHGIEPATGDYLKNLEALSRFAYDLIRIVELEKSGIRDGDGGWHGSDAMGGMCDEGIRLLGENITIATGKMECRNCHQFFRDGGVFTPWGEEPEAFVCGHCAQLLKLFSPSCQQSSDRPVDEHPF